MKNSKGIPCNETHFTYSDNRKQISFRFVSDDGVTPSSYTIRIGDTDPMTGEPITEMEFFQEYHRHADNEVYRNLKAIRPPYTQKQKEWREAEKLAFIRGFEQEYGYTPSADDIRYHMEEIEPERFHLYLDEILQQKGGSIDEYGKEFEIQAEDPFSTDLPDDLYALRELADSLTGRLRAVYDAMLQRAAGGADRMTLTDVQHEWGVSYNQIMKDTKKIEKMIREKIGKYR